MPTETNLQTVATLSPDVPAVYLKDKLLERAQKDTVFWALAEKDDQGQNNGKVCQFVRYERLSLPEAPAEEGVTPTATPMTLSTVQAVLDQWIAYVSMSDVAQLTIKHPLFQQARELLTLQHNETLDRECQVVLMGTSGVYYAGNQTSRANLTAADTLKSDDIRRVVAGLRATGARPARGNMFNGIVDPYVRGDLNKDATFVQAGTNVPDALKTLREFDIGPWLGVWWQESNLIPVISLMTAGDSVGAAVTGGSIPAGCTGFDASSTVRIKTTKLDSNTGFETSIDAEEAITTGAEFAISVTIASGAATGTYLVYSTLQGGATGTNTLQLRIRHTTGTATVVYLVKSGTPAASNVRVVTGTGRVAPPTPPSGVNVHISYVMGRGFFGATTLGGLQTFVTPAQASDSDPAAQRRKVSWKQLFKALILNPDFGKRIESASDFS